MDAVVVAELERAATGPITIDLTTIGHRSGAARRIEIWLVNVDGRLVIAGTPGPRDWLANVRRDPHVVVHLKEGATADLAATAVEIREPDRLRRIYTHPSTEWYRSQSSIDDLVARGPTIELVLGPTEVRG